MYSEVILLVLMEEVLQFLRTLSLSHSHPHNRERLLKSISYRRSDRMTAKQQMKRSINCKQPDRLETLRLACVLGYIRFSAVYNGSDRSVIPVYCNSTEARG